MIIVFDGVCNFCNGWVRFLLRRDRRAIFQFAQAQSPHGSDLLRKAGISPDDPDSILLVDDGASFVKSEAILRILWELAPPWPLTWTFIHVPRGLRDWCYDAFAGRRYRLFGMTSHCQVPDPRWRDRFIS